MINIHVKISVLALSVSLWCYAGNFEQGVQLYKEGKQTKAAAFFLKAAQNGDARAQYQLGYMYENGIGVTKNSETAALWYKRIASEYQNIPLLMEKIDPSEGIPMDLQQEPLTDAALQQFLFQSLDMPKESDERESMISSILSSFGLYPHEKNFYLPFVYTTQNYETFNQNSFPGYNKFNKNFEMEFQLSMKKPLTFDLFGLNEIIVVAYSQESWWQYYVNSSPFRETNYRPELWINIPVENDISKAITLKSYKVGLLHESNGRGKPLSRSWNRLYVNFLFQPTQTLLAEWRLWYATTSIDDDNIEDYLGNGHIKLNYFYGKHQWNMTCRNNLNVKHNRGSFELEWSYPIGHSRSSFWYVKAFSGYGASLIEYNKFQNRIGFGFTFSR